MTVISAGVVSKQGRVVLSRQFSDISRVRIEGLLSAFPRLLDASVNKQVTYIDAGTVRYVYQPLEELYLVLVTSKHSNIVEDLATLHLMGRLIPEYVQEAVTESSLETHSFPILFALDEVVVGGKRENTTVEQIHTFLEMDSHEERMAIEAKQQQIENAKRVTAQHARELRERKMHGGGSGGTYGGIGSDSQGYAGFGSNSSGGGADADYNSYDQARTISVTQPTMTASPAPPTASRASRPAMSLGTARKTDVSSKIQKEMGGDGVSVAGATPAGGVPPPAKTSAAGTDTGITGVQREGVHVVVEEKMYATLARDGEQGPVAIKGELSVLVSDPQNDHIKLVLAPVSSSFVFKAHARVNKALFANDHVLSMMNDKAFPVQQPVTILRWSSDSNVVQAPISFACWPEAGSITVEYELTNQAAPPLEHVQVKIPLYGASVVDISPSTGTCSVVDNGAFALWMIPGIDAVHNASGNVEISLANDGADASENVFFPMEVSFGSAVSVGLVRVCEVIHTSNGLPVRFSQETRLETRDFQIQ